MNNYLLVINAGSSSIKFAVYQKDESSVQLIADAAGQIEGIGGQPSFTVKNPDGLVLVDRTLTSGETPNHTGAITIIRTWLQEYLADGSLLAVGASRCPRRATLLSTRPD
jgi:acetate kinase